MVGELLLPLDSSYPASAEVASESHQDLLVVQPFPFPHQRHSLHLLPHSSVAVAGTVVLVPLVPAGSHFPLRTHFDFLAVVVAAVVRVRWPLPFDVHRRPYKFHRPLLRSGAFAASSAANSMMRT